MRQDPYRFGNAATGRSAASDWPLLARFIVEEAELAAWASRRPATHFLYEFIRFGVKQAWACLFGALLLALLILTWAFYPRDAWLARYDFLLLAALAIQGGLLWLRLETWAEARTIFVFHAVGTVMELYLTAKGAWAYPEPNVMRIGGVPLFTGFMYAAVGSFMARCWRLFDFRFTRHPPLWALGTLSVLIYANFFTRSVIGDQRAWLLGLAALLLGPCMIHYRIWRVHRRMPMLLAAALTAIFIWLAENIGTFTSTWIYPNQHNGWRPVGTGKLVSWFLLMIVSYTLVAWLNGAREIATRHQAKDDREIDTPAPATLSQRAL